MPSRCSRGRAPAEVVDHGGDGERAERVRISRVPDRRGEALDEASERAHVGSLHPLFGDLRVVGAHGCVLAAVLCDEDEDFVVEVDVAPAAEDELVDDRRVELEIEVLAVENAGVVRQRLL